MRGDTDTPLFTGLYSWDIYVCFSKLRTDATVQAGAIPHHPIRILSIDIYTSRVMIDFAISNVATSKTVALVLLVKLALYC